MTTPAYILFRIHNPARGPNYCPQLKKTHGIMKAGRSQLNRHLYEESKGRKYNKTVYYVKWSTISCNKKQELVVT